MNKHTDFLVIDACTAFSRPKLDDPNDQDHFTRIDMYDLADYDLSRHKCLAIAGLVDQEYLYRHRDKIRQFLDQKKVLVFCGNLFRDWLPGASPFVPKTIRSYADYRVSIHHPHPIFAGVSPDDMTFNKGVAGFFARGHHPPPPEAEVLLTLPGGEPITYIDRRSTKGTILVHSGGDLFGYYYPGKTTGRIAVQLVEWVRDEYRRLQERGE